MPGTSPTLSVRAARALIADRCLSPTEARRVGIEMEWFTLPRLAPDDHAPFDLVRAVCRETPLRAGSILTFEPGGQIELSSPAAPGARGAIDAITRDGDALRSSLARAGVDMTALGLDPRPHRRVIDAPRYRAMEEYFDSFGPEGRRMMCRTASMQLNLEAGSTREADRRWKVAHAIGPVLGAAFANSPLIDGAPSEWKSSRLATWHAMDRTRTWPAVSDLPAVEAWTRYALDARVMLIRADEDDYLPVLEPMTMREWIECGHPLGWPDEQDVAYHLTTLFPPVRLRGWLELRFVDASPWWHVAAAVATALLDDDEASARAEAACAPAADLWHQAARYGLDHPVLAAAARTCFDAALDALPRQGADPRTKDAIAAFAERYVNRGRTPADDADRRVTIPEAAWT